MGPVQTAAPTPRCAQRLRSCSASSTRLRGGVGEGRGVRRPNAAAYRGLRPPDAARGGQTEDARRGGRRLAAPRARSPPQEEWRRCVTASRRFQRTAGWLARPPTLPPRLLFRRDWLIEQPTPPLAARRALPQALPRARFGDVFAGPPGLRASARTDTVSTQCQVLNPSHRM